MELLCKRSRLVLLVVVCTARVLSLYEDQTGSYDWQQKYVGSVSYISVDQVSGGRRGVVVASETGVLAVLDPDDGSLVWRQLYEQDSDGSSIDAVLRSKFGSLFTVSRNGQLLRSWDISYGHLKYEVSTSLPSPPPRSITPAPLAQSWKPGGVLAALTGKKGGVVVVASRSEVTGFVARNGDMKWTHSLSGDSVVCSLYGGKDRVHVLSIAEALKLTQLNASNGAVLSSSDFLPAPWVHGDDVSCLLTVQWLWCVADMQLYSAELTATPIFQSFPLRSLLRVEVATQVVLVPSTYQNGMWLRAGRTHWLLTQQGADVSVSSELGGVPMVGHLDATSSEEGEALDVRLRGVAADTLTITHHRNGERKVGGVYTMRADRGNPVLASVQLHTRSDQSVASQVAVVMEDDSIVMFGSDGVKQWVREDGLGTIANLQFLDMPADQPAEVESFLEKTRAEVNPIKLAFLRWQLQAQLFKDFLGNLQRGDLTSLLQSDSTELVRDQFSTRKVILGITAKGKVYGLDSNNGGVVWQQFYPWLLPFGEGSPPLLYILRSTSHPLHPPLAVLIGRSKHPSCSTLSLMEFNPLTGSPASPGQPTLCLPPLAQTLLLPKEDHNHTKILLMLTADLEVISYPSSPEVTSCLTELKEQLFFFVASKEEGRIDGYYVNNEDTPSSELMSFPISQLWHISFPNATERLVSVIPKPMHEHVSTMGRSRVDRSIQYKYLNPNLVAVVTESTDPLRPAISIYLVDVVTGGVVFHTSHKAAVSPVHLVHSENWIVYQFLNSKQRRHELVVLELHERDSNHTRTVWSSLTPPPPPQVLSQAYAVPTSFLTIATTQTRRGITAKSILVGLQSGHIAAVPKTILDPRREMEPTDEMKEAGLPPYVPQLLFKPQIYVNYNQTVGRLRHIYSTATGLESTSLVLGCGLDLYFTRVLPSKQFDLLAVDFDYHLIAAVVVAMVTATIVLSKLSSRKSLKLLWE